MVEKKLRFWYEKDEKKRKRTLKISPRVTTPKIVIKEPTKKKSPPRLIDEHEIPPTDLIKQGAGLLNITLEEYQKHVADEPAKDAAKSQGSNVEKEAETSAKNVEAEGVKETLVEGVAESDSSATEIDDPTKIAPTSYISGKQKLKRSPKKKKDSDEEDSTYEPTPQEKKKKVQSVQVPEVEKKKAPKSPIFERVEKNDEVPENVEKVDDVEVEYMGERQSSPPPPPPINLTIHIHDDPKDPSSAKKATISSSSEGKINVLTKKVSMLEKAKAKAEAEREELKEKFEAYKTENTELKKAANNHSEIIDQLTDDLEEQNKVIDIITAEFDEVNEKYETMYETNKTLHQMIGELHETSSNENKVLRQEIETLRADKAVKDEQLNMLYTVIEHKLGFNSQSVFDELEIQRVEERIIEREKQLAEEAKQKKKGLVIDNEEILGSSSQQDPSEAEEEDKKKKDAELEQLFDDIDNYDPNGDNDDDDDQGATGLLVVKPSVFLTQPKVIFLHASFEGELEVERSRESMLEELGMDDGNLKFDIEYDIPPSPEREYTFKFVNEVDNFKDVIIEEGSDVSDEDTPFHYSDEVRRKVVERISSEGVPETVPQEELLEGRKKWFRVMPKERKYKRPLQYFTDHPDKSLGDILSWGYLEDLQVYAIQREHRVQYFQFLSDIKTLPWRDMEELVQTKNIKQFYYGLDVKMHDQKLWNYIKLQAKNKFPDWKPHVTPQIPNDYMCRMFLYDLA
ncbi:glutamic acid-rich protein-like [Helianthus annuus]|uniref:glutamic acid-rich protein-like n=1 Tax=Helianthus annuus TaxID=4232 RepID=UPI000B8F6D61|nr:glutamic acid-rich protein-like [Helianthus annuus]